MHQLIFWLMIIMVSVSTTIIYRAVVPCPKPLKYIELDDVAIANARDGENKNRAALQDCYDQQKDCLHYADSLLSNPLYYDQERRKLLK